MTPIDGFHADGHSSYRTALEQEMQKRICELNEKLQKEQHPHAQDKIKLEIKALQKEYRQKLKDSGQSLF